MKKTIITIISIMIVFECIYLASFGLLYDKYYDKQILYKNFIMDKPENLNLLFNYKEDIKEIKFILSESIENKYVYNFFISLIDINDYLFFDYPKYSKDDIDDLKEGFLFEMKEFHTKSYHFITKKDNKSIIISFTNSKEALKTYEDNYEFVKDKVINGVKGAICFRWYELISCANYNKNANVLYYKEVIEHYNKHHVAFMFKINNDVIVHIIFEEYEKIPHSIRENIKDNLSNAIKKYNASFKNKKE